MPVLCGAYLRQRRSSSSFCFLVCACRSSRFTTVFFSVLFSRSAPGHCLRCCKSVRLASISLPLLWLPRHISFLHMLVFLFACLFPPSQLDFVSFLIRRLAAVAVLPAGLCACACAHCGGGGGDASLLACLRGLHPRVVRSVRATRLP